MKKLPVTRADLGTTRKEQEQGARALAYEFIEGLVARPTSNTTTTSGPLTFDQLGAIYEQRAFAGRTASYRRDAVARVCRFADFVGRDREVASLRPSDVQAYTAHRAAQGVRTAHRADILAVKTALSWAVGEDLLTISPFDTFKKKRDRDVIPPKGPERRPVATPARYQKLVAVASKLPPAFEVLLTLAWETGHRLSAMLELRWGDVTFDTSEAEPWGAIRWYAGTTQANTKRHEHVVPMNEQARQALVTWRAQCPGIAKGFVFPSPKAATEPLRYSITRRWLRKGEQLAGLEPQPAGGWHAFRRAWATERKQLSLKDVAAAGGWKDTGTLLTCYQHPDPATTLAVVEHGA
jgi:integrase